MSSFHVPSLYSFIVPLLRCLLFFGFQVMPRDSQGLYLVPNSGINPGRTWNNLCCWEYNLDQLHASALHVVLPPHPLIYFFFILFLTDECHTKLCCGGQSVAGTLKTKQYQNFNIRLLTFKESLSASSYLSVSSSGLFGYSLSKLL